MKCAMHPETDAAAFCRTCGKALCEECKRPKQGTMYCEEHVPAVAESPSPYSVPPQKPVAIPGLAFVLGLIPGVGAIYNGQYAKGLVHALIFGMLVSLASSDVVGAAGPLLGFLIAAFVMYMAFEAYHTARKRNLGETVEEFSSILPEGSGASNAWAITLIALGVLFLLINLDLLSVRLLWKYWPVLLIAAGANMLYARLKSRTSEPEPPAEVSHERN